MSSKSWIKFCVVLKLTKFCVSEICWQLQTFQFWDYGNVNVAFQQAKYFSIYNNPSKMFKYLRTLFGRLLGGTFSFSKYYCIEVGCGNSHAWNTLCLKKIICNLVLFRSSVFKLRLPSKEGCLPLKLLHSFPCICQNQDQPYPMLY